MARIPAQALTLLGSLRTYASVQVRVEQTRAWVRWDEAGFEILRALLPVRGAEFFERLEARWHLCGHSLPAFDVPQDGFVPLASVLTPAPILTRPSETDPLPRVVLALRRSEVIHETSAMLTTPKALAEWADMATEAEIASVSAARSGELVLLMGDRLPVAPGERYWGVRLLFPLGWAPDPNLPESALLEALGVEAQELALVRRGAVEVIPRDVLRPLTRASARLAAG